MPVSQSLASSSIDLLDLPAEVAEAIGRVVEFCREQVAPASCAGSFETVETKVRDAMNSLGRTLLGACAESRDDGASRIERDGLSWFRVAETPKTIMTTLGPVTFRRARYRTGACGRSVVPVDESLGLIDDYLTRPAAQLGLMMMGHCTAREAEEFFAKMGALTPSVSTLQRLTLSMHERWEDVAPQTRDTVYGVEDIPSDAVSASVSLDGIMVGMRAGEDGRTDACWREASCGTISFHDAAGKRLRTLYFGRMPESGKVTLKGATSQPWSPISGVSVRRSGSVPWRMLPPTTGPFCRAFPPRPRPSTSGMPASTFAWPLTRRWRPTGSRSTARSCAPTRTASSG